MYYGKKYGFVRVSESKKEADIYAHAINNMFGDYGKGEIRKTLQNIKHLVLIDHVEKDNKISYLIYVRQPYDKLIRKI